MRPACAVLAALLLVPAASPARAASAFAAVPAGARVHVMGGASHAALAGTLVRASDDSLWVRPRHGGAVVAMDGRDVRSLAFASGRRPSGRLNTLAGIGVGAAGGAVAAVAFTGQGQGGGSSGGGGGGEGGGDRAPALAAAATTTAPAPPAASAAYRAVFGAVLGGIVGGLLPRVVNFGIDEDVWTTVPGPVARAMGVPARTPRTVLAVRIPFGAAR